MGGGEVEPALRIKVGERVYAQGQTFLHPPSIYPQDVIFSIEASPLRALCVCASVNYPSSIQSRFIKKRGRSDWHPRVRFKPSFQHNRLDLPSTVRLVLLRRSG